MNARAETVPPASAEKQDGRGAGRSAWLGAALAGLALYAGFAAHFDWLCDDAYISFRYARNWAEGHGLVFNVGAAPVEGYSNLLWVLVAAAFERAGLDVTLVRWISACAGAALLLGFARFTSRGVGLGAPATWAATVFLATLPPFGLWATSGLETLPFAACLFGYFAALFDPRRPRPWLAGLAGVAAVLLRADGVLFVLLVSAGVGVSWSVSGSRPPQVAPPWRALGGTLGITALALVGATLWRLGTYGDWLPNTVRAKSALSTDLVLRGARYAAVQALTVPALVLPLVALPLALRRRPGAALAAGVILAGTWAYAILTGGDFMPLGRFLVPGLPFTALAVGLAVEPRSGHRAGWKRAGLALLVLAPLSLPASFDRHVVPESVRARFHFRWNSAQYQSEYQNWLDMRVRLADQLALGRAVGNVAEPGASIVAGAIGGFGYASRLTLHDQNGLVDREVARLAPTELKRSPGHDRFVSRSWFRHRRPTYAAASMIDLATGRFAPAERWDGERPPDRAPEEFEIELFVRSDAKPHQVAALARQGWTLRQVSRDESLPPGWALRLVRWR